MSHSNMLKINLVGSNTIGYVGEMADELIIKKGLEKNDCLVHLVPRDIWKAYTDGERNSDWNDKLPMQHDVDINIICKWHHFNDGKYINYLREYTNAPVFYWVWDYMDYSGFHEAMVKSSDLYLGNDCVGRDYDKFYYFPFDCSDADISFVDHSRKIYDVVFFGSCLDQGDRKEWLPEIADHCDLTVFSWNWKEWIDLGVNAFPPVWGEEFAKRVSESKICLQMSVNDHTWGYWSNRVGKILSVGGFLLARYAPGMELFLRDGADYFSSVDEARDKINFYLKNPSKRNDIAKKGLSIGRDRFTIQERTKDLKILIERYLKGAF